MNAADHDTRYPTAHPAGSRRVAGRESYPGAGQDGASTAAVVLITADPRIRAQVRRCAARAGAFLAEYHDLPSAQQHDVDAAVVLLGADLATAAPETVAEAWLAAPGQLLVVVARRADADLFAIAAALHAPYVTLAPAELAWLTGRLRTAAEGTVDRLRQAGFRLGYTAPNATEPYGRVHPLQVSSVRLHDEQVLYVILEDVARSDRDAGQTAAVHRSNYRTLHRRYPDLWTDLRSQTVTVLGAFVADLPPAVVDLLYRLRHEHPVLDQHDLIQLRAKDIHTSWQRVTCHEVRLELCDAARDVYDALGPDDRDELWWDTVDGIDAWPEHDGRRICWDLERLVPAFAARLHAEFRRTWRPDPRYQISPIQPQRTWDPCWQVHHNGQLIAAAYTRHEARVAIWRHQRTGRT